MTAHVHPARVVSVPVGDLIVHPRNPRQGDVGAVVESIEANGFYGALVVQSSSGHVLAGNHRLLAAVALGIEELPVLYLDVDDAAALRILLADNRTSDLATYDDRALADLLTELAAAGGLIGSGYDGDALDELLRDLAELDIGVEDERKTMTCPACGHQWALG